MNMFINSLKDFFRSLFSRSKKVVKLPQNEEEYDGWLGV